MGNLLNRIRASIKAQNEHNRHEKRITLMDILKRLAPDSRHLSTLERVAVAAAFMLLLFLALRPDQAQAIPAFPGAQGGGAASLGGRGGRVIKVINLNNAGPGSLRDCIVQSGPRTCVFTVGGTINITSALSILNPFITIAGHTAPGGGIQISGKNTAQTMFVINAHNVVMRYLRIRKGFNVGCSGDAECAAGILGFNPSNNVIIDHVSFSWNQDEAMGVGSGVGTSVNKWTFSYNIVAEALRQHSTGFIVLGNRPTDSVGMTDIDFHHNLTMTNANRNPLFRGKSTRIVNNLWYNLFLNATSISGGVNADIIGNKYRRGPIKPDANFAEIGACDNCQDSLDAPGAPSLYVLGNIGWHQPNPSGDQNFLTFRQNGENGPQTGALPVAWRRSTPMANTTHPITAEAVSDIETTLLPIVGDSRGLDCDGKWLSRRDSHDAKLITQYNTNTAPNDRYATELEYGGFPSIAGGTPCADTDNDGMPNQYEVIKGYNPSLSDQNTVLGSGYTRLETFLSGEEGETPRTPDDDKFEINDRVFVNASSVNVRATPGGTLTGTQVRDKQGVVTDGPTAVPSNGVIWYLINFDTGTDGWVGSDLLERVIDSDFPPTVAITAPVNGAQVTGTTFEIKGTAIDNTAVVGYRLLLDGANLGSEDTSGSSSYSFLWNTTLVTDGPHTLAAVARDGAGNSTTSGDVQVTVDNSSPADVIPPAVSLTAPAPGNVSGAAVAVTATASDAVGVVGVSFHFIMAAEPVELTAINMIGAEDTTSTYGVTWDTSALVNGAYSLFAVARDAAGNKTTSAAVAVTVANGLAVPSTLSVTREAP